MEAVKKLFHSFGIAVDDNFDDLEAETNQESESFDQHEVLWHISDEILDRVPRWAFGPDLDVVGFEKGWTNRDSN